MSQDGNYITHSWRHSSNTISHYILTFVETEDGSQILQFNVISTSITIPSTSIDLNGTLSAVSVCGDMSDAVSFQGKSHVDGESLLVDSSYSLQKMEAKKGV